MIKFLTYLQKFIESAPEVFLFSLISVSNLWLHLSEK